MPPRTQYLPVAGISQTDPWISQTDSERTAREARMSASRINKYSRIFLKMDFWGHIDFSIKNCYGLLNNTRFGLEFSSWLHFKAIIF